MYPQHFIIQSFQVVYQRLSASDGDVSTNSEVVGGRIDRISELSNISKEIKEYKKSQENDLIKAVSDPIKSFSDPIKERLYQAVLKDGTLNYAEYAAIIGASEATVKRRLGELKKDGFIIRVGSNKTGHWEIMNNRHL